MTETPLKACGILLFRGKPPREFLLMRHADRWDLPKGHIEPGENERECALREFHEETGIDPGAIELDPAFRFTLQYPVQSRRHGGAWVEKTLVIFLACLKDETAALSELQLTEHLGHSWFAWRPPHTIQAQTVDPLLAAAAAHLAGNNAPSTTGVLQ